MNFYIPTTPTFLFSILSRSFCLAIPSKETMIMSINKAINVLCKGFESTSNNEIGFSSSDACKKNIKY